MSPERLILASSSRYRQELLSRLKLPFKVAIPDIDESPLPGESPLLTATRLSEQKARAVAHLHPGALIIGSDQVAVCEGQRLDKPMAHALAVSQLLLVSGRPVVFQTAVTVFNSASGNVQTEVIPTDVRFRVLSKTHIESYLSLEPAYDCAGSAKVEGLGISLMEHIRSADPTALIGLPLLALCRMLRAAGADPLDTTNSLP